jgi:hypothetical protein
VTGASVSAERRTGYRRGDDRPRDFAASPTGRGGRKRSIEDVRLGRLTSRNSDPVHFSRRKFPPRFPRCKRPAQAQLANLRPLPTVSELDAIMDYPRGTNEVGNGACESRSCSDPPKKLALFLRIRKTYCKNRISATLDDFDFKNGKRDNRDRLGIFGFLQNARGELEAAVADKGGHRVKAISLSDEAIHQVREGMAAAGG